MAWIALLTLAQEVPSRWDFKPGSWVEMTYRSLRSEIASPRAYREDIGMEQRRPAPFHEGLKETARRADTWMGRPCLVIDYVSGHGTVRAWVVEGMKIPARDMPALPRFVAVPADVVRVERAEAAAGSSVTMIQEVVEIDARIEAAGRAFDCVVEASWSTADLPSGTRCTRSRRRWLSAEVPGHVVRQLRQCSGDPAAVPHDYDMRDELKAFHIER
jgi:hypothetical protein